MILGRQPELGLAELESLYGGTKVEPLGQQAALVHVDPCLLAFDRLGGSTKFCKLLTTLDTVSWADIQKFLVQVSPGHAERMPEGKMRLGLSVIGFDITLAKLESIGLTVKKAIKKTGRNVRLIPNKEQELNSAQIIHNQLTGPTGWELILIRLGNKTVIAQTIKVQDIASYTDRDRERPKRDAKVGMLPPKLAQIIINLAVGNLPDDTLQNICDIPAGQPISTKVLDKTILDPFCGTGVILQEALLMGYDVYGSDLESRMIDYSKANLAWLEQQYGARFRPSILESGDATTFSWKAATIDYIACEGYLGRPFTERPSAEILNQTIGDCNLIAKKFLKNIRDQLKPGTRLCFAVPAWQVRRDEFKRLPFLDSLGEIGYNRVEFERVSSNSLMYYRADQIVARELLVLTVK